jgi:hypothetical protein
MATSPSPLDTQTKQSRGFGLITPERVLYGETMKVKTALYVYHNQYSWQDQPEITAFTYRVDDNEHRTFVGEQEVELHIPDEYDPRAQKIAALEKQKQKIMAEYQKSVTDINERISKLQALEYTA